MPRKKKDPTAAPASPGGVLLTMQPGTTPDQDPDDGPDLSPEQTAELDAIEERFQGIPGDTPVEVYRYGEDGELGFCGKMPAHTFSPDAVARRWRTAGKYRAIARIKDRSGKVIAGGIRNKVFNLDEISVAELAGPIPLLPTAAGAAPVSLDMTMASALASLLATVTTAMGNMMQAVQQRPPALEVNPLDMLDKVSSIAEKLAGRSGGPENEMASRMVSMVNDVLDIKDRLGENGPGPQDPLMQIARENLPRLIGVLENAGKNNADARALLQDLKKNKQLPAGAPAQTPATEPAKPAEEGKPMWWIQFAKRLPYFVQLAVKDKDPVLMGMAEAELVDGTDVVEPLKQFLAEPGVEEKLVQFAPELKDYAEWVIVFVSQLKESLGLIPEGTTDALLVDDEPAGPRLVEEAEQGPPDFPGE